MDRLTGQKPKVYLRMYGESIDVDSQAAVTDKEVYCHPEPRRRG